MIVRTCLLISDDPDDHMELSEALNEISKDTVLVAVAHPEKALAMLGLKRCIPDYIFLNLAVNGFSPDVFFATLDADVELMNVRVIAYGEIPDFEKLNKHRVTGFINSDVSYTELRESLGKIMGREGWNAG